MRYNKIKPHDIYMTLIAIILLCLLCYTIATGFMAINEKTAAIQCFGPSFLIFLAIVILYKLWYYLDNKKYLKNKL